MTNNLPTKEEYEKREAEKAERLDEISTRLSRPALLNEIETLRERIAELEKERNYFAKFIVLDTESYAIKDAACKDCYPSHRHPMIEQHFVCTFHRALAVVAAMAESVPEDHQWE